MSKRFAFVKTVIAGALVLCGGCVFMLDPAPTEPQQLQPAEPMSRLEGAVIGELPEDMTLEELYAEIFGIPAETEMKTVDFRIPASSVWHMGQVENWLVAYVVEGNGYVRMNKFNDTMPTGGASFVPAGQEISIFNPNVADLVIQLTVPANAVVAENPEFEFFEMNGEVGFNGFSTQEDSAMENARGLDEMMADMPARPDPVMVRSNYSGSSGRSPLIKL